MHRRKYDVNVEELLRLALLIENGGVMLIVGDAILIEGLDWIKNIFEGPKRKENEGYSLQCPLDKSPELFMFRNNKFYSDLFIASQKNSSLLWTIFLQMANAI